MEIKYELRKINIDSGVDEHMGELTDTQLTETERWFINGLFENPPKNINQGVRYYIKKTSVLGQIKVLIPNDTLVVDTLIDVIELKK